MTIALGTFENTKPIQPTNSNKNLQKYTKEKDTKDELQKQFKTQNRQPGKKKKKSNQNRHER